jgi:carboxyl-terminal processing protease
MEKVTPSKERDLDKFKKEIKSLLENEIVSRYYYQTGRTEHTLSQDECIEKAIETVKNKTSYNTILKK